jgi:hypothetical protein
MLEIILATDIAAHLRKDGSDHKQLNESKEEKVERRHCETPKVISSCSYHPLLYSFLGTLNAVLTPEARHLCSKNMEVFNKNLFV